MQTILRWIRLWRGPKVGTIERWPDGRIWRFNEDGRWGACREMIVLPMAEILRRARENEAPYTGVPFRHVK